LAIEIGINLVFFKDGLVRTDIPFQQITQDGNILYTFNNKSEVVHNGWPKVDSALVEKVAKNIEKNVMIASTTTTNENYLDEYLTDDFLSKLPPLPLPLPLNSLPLPEIHQPVQVTKETQELQELQEETQELPLQHEPIVTHHRKSNNVKSGKRIDKRKKSTVTNDEETDETFNKLKKLRSHSNEVLEFLDNYKEIFDLTSTIESFEKVVGESRREYNEYLSNLVWK
jgi:hypothetical protein